MADQPAPTAENTHENTPENTTEKITDNTAGNTTENTTPRTQVNIAPSAVVGPVVFVVLAVAAFRLFYPTLPVPLLLAVGLITAVSVPASLVIHELGHVAMGALLRLPPKEVRFTWAGAAVYLDVPDDLPIRRIVLLYLSGPAVNLAAAAAAYGVRSLLSSGPLSLAVGVFLFCNLALGLTNLLPFRPLDGYSALEALRPRLGVWLGWVVWATAALGLVLTWGTPSSWVVPFGILTATPALTLATSKLLAAKTSQSSPDEKDLGSQTQSAFEPEAA